MGGLLVGIGVVSLAVLATHVIRYGWRRRSDGYYYYDNDPRLRLHDYQLHYALEKARADARRRGVHESQIDDEVRKTLPQHAAEARNITRSEYDRAQLN